MKLCLIRHGPTAWNAQHRVQGSIDIPLSAEGRARMERLLPPAGFETARAYASPKLRARQTASCLGLKQVRLEPRLVEQNWGEWEGLTRAEMLERDGEDAFARSGRGLAFRPPGGESTGELHARVKSFFADAAGLGEDAVAVTHMGVLRAAYVMATGWNMDMAMPEELDLKAALILALAPEGAPAIAQLNAPLRQKS
ncbi:MAG TPA: histidine phosphatase family protein [Rhizomicrobium sp.]|nr:histidine phosphatase family protein [Rhizomicrobium sp.]